MAAGLLLTRLMFCLLVGILYSARFLKAESIAADEVAELAYLYLNEKLPVYIQQKQPELAQLWEHVKNSVQEQPGNNKPQTTKPAVQKQTAKLPAQRPPQLAQRPPLPAKPYIQAPNTQSYLPQLVGLVNLASAMKSPEPSHDRSRHAEPSPYKPQRSSIQDWLGGTLSDLKEIPALPTFSPHIHLTVSVPGANDLLGKVASLRPESFRYPTVRREPAKERPSEVETVRRPAQSYSPPRYGPAYNRPDVPYAVGYRSSAPSKPSYPPQRASSPPGSWFYGSAPTKPQVPPYWVSSPPGYYPQQAKPTTPPLPQWVSAYRAPVPPSTTQPKYRAGPQWPYYSQ